MDEEAELMQKERKLNDLLEEFAGYLRIQKGFSAITVERHVSNIDMFARQYLLNYYLMDVTEADGADIYDYLSDWYARKVINAKKSDIKENLASFKKFFTFLHENGKITANQLDEIKEECKDPARYVKEFEAHFVELYSDDEREGGEENRNAMEDEESGLRISTMIKHMLQHDEPAGNVENQLRVTKLIGGIDVALIPAVHGVSSTFLDDFSRLVNYCIQHDGMKLSPRTAYFGTKIVHEMNTLLLEPEQLIPTAKQPDSIFIHSFHLIIKAIGLFDITGNMKFTITSKAARFLDLTKVDQFLIIFNTIWNKVSWIDLNNGISGRPEWAYEKREGLASILGAVDPGKKYNYIELLKKDESGTPSSGFTSSVYDQIWEFITGVIPERVLPMLKFMGLIDLDYEKFVPGPLYMRRIGNVTVTPLGRTIFNAIESQKVDR